MKRVIMLIAQLLILLIILGCSTQTQFDNVLAPNKENTNKQQDSDKTQEAELNGFSLDRQDTVLLELSNTINIEKQVAVKLLSPDEPIWNGELRKFNWGFGAYKFEGSLHDVTLNKISKEKLMFSDPIVSGGSGPVYIAKVATSPDDSKTIIYIGIGQEKRNATVQAVGNNIKIQIK